MSTPDKRELAAERVEKIRRILKTRGIARVEELCEELGVSAATVRRDLVELDGRGDIRRVHGGAVHVEGRLDEPVFDDKTSIAEEEKQRIAEAALPFIKSGHSIFLDGGSTVLALARLLRDMTQLTVVTNSLRVAGLFAGTGPRMILIGGELRRLSQTFVGPLAQMLIDQLRVDTAFMGTIGLSAAEGMTTTDPREAATKKIIMAHARQVILLADSSKLGKVSFVKSGALDQIDVALTDSGAAAAELKKLKKTGLKIIKCR